MPDTEDIVRATYQCYVDKDRARLESLVAPDFHFTSPLDDRLDRATYFERCWPNSENLTGFEFQRIFVRGGQAFVTYEATTKAGKRFRNTEFLTVRDGQLVEAEVYFGWDIPHPKA
jgi:ketosteroid isomerase-like protein